MSLKSSPKATTFRLDPSVQESLVLLSKVTKAPLNRLVNEAVRAFVNKRTKEISMTMEETLRLLKANIENDPGFEKAIQEFAENEAAYAKDDPTEGKIINPSGPVSSKIHNLPECAKSPAVQGGDE